MGVFPVEKSLVVITGAGSGIGAGLAKAMAERGASLALVDRNPAGLETLAAGLPNETAVSLHQMDVTDTDAVDDLPDAVSAEHGRPADILVNNAGVALAGEFHEVSEADFDWLLSINLAAPIRLTRAFLPVLRDRPAAQIVNVSSIFGVVGPPGQTAYSTAKFGLRGFSEALRHELEGSPVGVTVVHPGGVNTNIARNARDTRNLAPAEREAALNNMQKMLRMPPENAGEIIARGIEARAPRILVGGDARMIDLIQRAAPARYWSLLSRLFRR